MPASFPFSNCIPNCTIQKGQVKLQLGTVFSKTPSPIEIVLIVLFIFPRPPYLCLEQVCLCLNMEVSTLQFCKASYDCKSQTGASEFLDPSPRTKRSVISCGLNVNSSFETFFICTTISFSSLKISTNTLYVALRIW